MSKAIELNIQKAKLLFLLRNDQDVLERAMLHIHARQTADEQQAKTTAHDNGMGWTGADARFASEMAGNIKKWGHLKGGQIDWCRKHIVKYAGQLLSSGFECDTSSVNLSAKDELVAKAESITKETDPYLYGLIEGIKAYAYWKRGMQYVGTSEVPLEEAIADAVSGKWPMV